MFVMKIAFGHLSEINSKRIATTGLFSDYELLKFMGEKIG